MKKILVIFFVSVCCNVYSSGGGDYWEDYYNLFMQEIIGDPQYFPFLFTYDYNFYESAGGTAQKNENIEEWCNYLKISYNDACYLVFKAKKADIDTLIAGKTVKNDTLKFANANFVKKYIQALKYISYSKFLEPYMVIAPSPDGWWANDSAFLSVKCLEYSQIENVLLRSFNAETDKELKLRYGYQLVRWAHYNGKHKEAIEYFKKHVQSLDYKPVMYYYALDQKAGAERGLGNFTQASRDYMTVFHNVKNRKENAYLSLKFCNQASYNSGNWDYSYYDFSENYLQTLLKTAQTDNERNDVYLLLGRLEFNNPLRIIEKIVKKTPDAIQAKVLLARSVSYMERKYLPELASFANNKSTVENEEKLNFWQKIFIFFKQLFSKPKKTKHLTNEEKRLPLSPDEQTQSLSVETLQLVENQTKNKKVTDKNFWNYTAAYLHFLQKNYSEAKVFLAQVTETDSIYQNQKTQLAMLIEICEQPAITPEFEQKLFSQYKELFEKNVYQRNYYWYNTNNTTFGFVIDILANRYFLQKEYAKAFLLHNDLYALKYNPDLQLISDIEILYHKKNKSPMELYLVEKITPFYTDCTYEWNGKEHIVKRHNITYPHFNFDEYMNYIRGNVYLAQGNFEKSLRCFQNVSANFAFQNEYWEKEKRGPKRIPNFVFAYNLKDYYNCEKTVKELMNVAYLSDFEFIKSKMTYRELAETLLKLQNTGKGNDELAAKANYLIANFLYNTTSMGYYHQLLRFGYYSNNFSNNFKPNFTNKVYFKNYFLEEYLPDNLALLNDYLQRAMKLTKNDDLKAHIIFALSASEQEEFEIKKEEMYRNNAYDWQNQPEVDGILITNRKYFKELQKYAHTDFYEEVRTNCLYFEYYVANN